MTFIVISILVEAVDDVSAVLDRARMAVSSGAALVEWRIDPIGEEPEAAAAVLRLVRESPAPCIVTCRSREEGGHFGGDDRDRISLLEAIGAAEHPPRYVDVELATYQRSRNLRQKVNLAVDHPSQVRDLQTGLILSTHDFAGRPADLMQRVEAMAAEPACRVIKAAWRARSLRDNLEAFDLLAERQKPMAAICMGEFGQMSRVLAPKFGGLLTFAADPDEGPTAPGQLTVGELRGVYRFDAIGRATKVFGVIGWPVTHSKSPQIHNAAMARVGFDGVYLPLPVPPEWEHFKATVGALVDHPKLDFTGASVTIPHKEHLVRFVEERGGVVEPFAAAIGAGNTLMVRPDGMLECANTDGPAVVGALACALAVEADGLRGLRVAVVGAGGAARAAAGALALAGASVVIFNRTIARAESLAERLRALRRADGSPVKVAAGKLDSLGCGCFEVVVNGTPVGMAGGPAPDESPLPDDMPLDDSVTVFDTVYSPRRTPLIREAQSRGARVIDGVAMFIRQAAMQFERWTGEAMPRAVIEEFERSAT